MQVQITNAMLSNAVKFMYDLKLVRKKSRFRRRFIDMLMKQQEEVSKDRRELLEHYAEKDEHDNAIIGDDGNYKIKDGCMDALTEDMRELNKESLVIEGGDNRELIRTIRDVLRGLEDQEYEGSDSEVYDYLCDAFGVDEEEYEESEGGAEDGE